MRYIVLDDFGAKAESPYIRCVAPRVIKTESVMAKGKYRDILGATDQSNRQKSILFELKGARGANGASGTTVSTELFAALTIEEVIAYVRTHQPDFEIAEMRVVGRVQVPSTSEHL